MWMCLEEAAMEEEGTIQVRYTVLPYMCARSAQQVSYICSVPVINMLGIELLFENECVPLCVCALYTSKYYDAHVMCALYIVYMHVGAFICVQKSVHCAIVIKSVDSISRDEPDSP